VAAGRKKASRTGASEPPSLWVHATAKALKKIARPTNKKAAVKTEKKKTALSAKSRNKEDDATSSPSFTDDSSSSEGTSRRAARPQKERKPVAKSSANSTVRNWPAKNSPKPKRIASPSKQIAGPSAGAEKKASHPSSHAGASSSQGSPDTRKKAVKATKKGALSKKKSSSKLGKRRRTTSTSSSESSGSDQSSASLKVRVAALDASGAPLEKEMDIVVKTEVDDDELNVSTSLDSTGAVTKSHAVKVRRVLSTFPGCVAIPEKNWINTETL
jgi:hypothetical protein